MTDEKKTRKGNTEPDTAQCSESHDLEKEIRDAQQELQKINTENKELTDNKRKELKQKTQGRNRTRNSRISIALWIVICIMLVMIATIEFGGEQTQKLAGKAAAPTHESTAEIAKNLDDNSKIFYGLVLKSLRTGKKEYHAGEEATIEAEFQLNGTRNVEATITYELYDPSGQKVYSYSEQETIENGQHSTVKLTLLADNYQKGTYTIDSKIRFLSDGRKYVLPARTSFSIVERERPSLQERAGKAMQGMGQTQTEIAAALCVLIIFNIVLMYNTQRKKDD